MRVVCTHGFIKYFPTRVDEVIRFKRVFNVNLTAERDYFTLSGLVGLPRHSIAGALYGSTLARETYEGVEPADVMRVNRLVYNLALSILTPMETVISVVNLPQTNNYAVSASPFLQPGVFNQLGQKIVGYMGELDIDMQRLYLYAQETV